MSLLISIFPLLMLALGSGKTDKAPEAFDESNTHLLEDIWADVAEPPGDEMSEWIAEYKKEEETLMEPTGPIPEGWPFVGVDIEAEMEKLPGGKEEQYLVSNTGGLLFFAGAPDFPAQEWQLLFNSRSAEKDANVQRGNLYSLTDRHLLFSGSINRKVGNAYCWTSSMPPVKNAAIYRARSIGFSPKSSDDVSAEEMASSQARFLMSIGIAPMCEVFSRLEDGGFTSMVHNMKGEPLAGWVVSPKTYRIVPKSKLQPLTTDRKRQEGR